MQTIGFGLSAPIAFDAMLATGDELIVGFAITALIALNISARAVFIGVILACLALLPHFLMANRSVVSSTPWLAALVSLIGILWMIRCVLAEQTQLTYLGWSDPIAWLRYQLQRATSSRNLSILLAGVSTFSIIILLGVETRQELEPIARQSPFVLPLALGVLMAIVNTLGIGTLLILLLSNKPGTWPPRSSNAILVIGALLVAFGAYCAGRAVAFDWPGDELAIAGMALVLWVLGRWQQVYGRDSTQG